MEPIRVLVVRPGSKPIVEEHKDELKVWQKLVKGDDEESGTIDIVHLHDGVYMICNDNGQSTCEYNRKVPGMAPEIPDWVDFVIAPPNAAKPGTEGMHDVYGTFILVRNNGQEADLLSLQPEDIQKWTAILVWTVS